MRTLGCRSNYFDSELIKTKFLKAGYKVVEGKADVYVINTCTVTSGADRSSRNEIYRAKRENPNSIVVATGCYAQVSPQALAQLKEVDLVVGNTYKAKIVELVEEYMRLRGKRVLVDNVFKEKEVSGFEALVLFERARPVVKVEEGCNRFCSFCVIPYARGKVRSVPREKVLELIKELTSRGFEEVVLTGTQLTQYGWDRGESLYLLIKELLKVKGLKLLRLSSLKADEVDEKLLELLVKEELIAPHFHLPLQSGSDKVLKDMNRGYTLKEYLKVLEKLLKRDKVAIGTDVIVGFPSEREEDFLKTYKVLKEYPFAYLHPFPYSRRPYTKAGRMKEGVSQREKEERVKLLKELDAKKRKEFYEKNLGRRLRATVISQERLLTENYIEVKRENHFSPGKVVEIVLGS